jgi:hypothetical protein
MDHYISGAIQLGQSLLTRNNPCAIAADGIVNQAQVGLTRMFPDLRFIQRWGAAYIQEIFSAASDTVCIDPIPAAWRR